MLTESERAELERLVHDASASPPIIESVWDLIDCSPGLCEACTKATDPPHGIAAQDDAMLAWLWSNREKLLALDAEVGRLEEACRSVVYEFGGDDSAGLTDGERAAVDKCKATLTPAGDGEVGA